MLRSILMSCNKLRLKVKEMISFVFQIFAQLGFQPLPLLANTSPSSRLLSAAPGTIFDKILDGSIPAEFLHQDDQCVAFKDVSPQAPVHFLVIPRRRISMIQEVQPSDRDLLGHLLITAANVAKQQGLSDGYR